MKSEGEKTRDSLLVVTAGWYGLGHLAPLSAIIKRFRTLAPDTRVSLLTLPFEHQRLADWGLDHLYAAVYDCAPVEDYDFRTYAARNAISNRERFRAVVEIERPKLVLVHWMMLLEVLDMTVLKECRVVAVLEETEWGGVRPEDIASPYFAPIDVVIFADGGRSDREGLTSGQFRVGMVTDYATAPPPFAHQASSAETGRPLVIVNSGGGAYHGTHSFLRALLQVAVHLPHVQFLFVCGPLVPEELQRTIAASDLGNTSVIRTPSRQELLATLENADLVVHGGGVSSTAECLAMRKRSIAVSWVDYSSWCRCSGRSASSEFVVPILVTTCCSPSSLASANSSWSVPGRPSSKDWLIQEVNRCRAR